MPPFSHQLHALWMTALLLLSTRSQATGAGMVEPLAVEQMELNVHGPDPEIDRSPIWAVVYGRYLYLLGTEMFWPGIDRKDRFRIAVVNWPELAADLGVRLDGRAIAGLPVDIVALEAKELANEKGDYTMLFLGGSAHDDMNGTLSQSLTRWQRKGDRKALVLTDGGDVEGHDVIFKRMKVDNGLALCVLPDGEALTSKSLDLPVHFLQKRCP